MVVEFLRRVFVAHYSFPKVLRVWAVAPATILFVVVTGLTFTLPPGPLCDEGMVLFMEGGCDWGDSNVFFFSKVGLLVALNLTLILAWQYRVIQSAGFLPHFVLLALAALCNLSGGHCETYYSHPNESLGQMIIECIAFALAGLAFLARPVRPGRVAFSLFLFVWNGWYVVAFYAALAFTHHWTWVHTAAIVASLLALACTVRILPSRSGSISTVAV